jgi:hypothetical protein
LSHAGEWNDPHYALFRCISPTLKTVEEESAILNYWSANRPTKRIANQLWPGVPLISDILKPQDDVSVSSHKPTIPVIEKIVCGEYCVSMSFKERTVEIIGARLRYN